MSKKLTTEEFISKSIKIHGDTYNYSLVDYKNAKDKVIIICSKHGEFETHPSKHTNKRGCPECAKYKRRKRLTNEQFINRSIKMHGDRYVYSDTQYVDSITKVKIICKKHGEFETHPSNHLMGHNCPGCGFDIGSKKKIKHHSKLFKDKAKKIHGDKYDYSLVEYFGEKHNIKIICEKHGVFKQKPTKHLGGHGCVKCCQSNGERQVEAYLGINGIKFEAEKRFSWAIIEKGRKRNKKYYYYYDFYLPEFGCVIEYHGQQHYHEINGFFGADEGLEKRQNNDKIKKDLAEVANLIYVEIPYNKSVNIVLKQYLG